MKSRERLKRLRESKSWTERLELAGDALPGTKFDVLIKRILGALGYLENFPQPEKTYNKDGLIDVAGLSESTLQAFGHDLAIAIREGNSKLFREWAAAIDEIQEWRSLTPQVDKVREAIILFCVPPTRTFTMRSIIAHLKKRGLIKESDDLDVIRRIVCRYCHELSIGIKGPPGRPSQTRTRTRKKRRLKS